MILVSVLVGLVLAVVLLGVAGHALVSVLLTDDSASEDAAVAEGAESTTPEDVVALASDGGTIELNDRVYTVTSTDDGYAFVCQDADASDDALTLFTLSGEPVGFAIHQGTFYVVSNADGSFYVQTYVPSDGSVPSDYQQGEGTIADIAIEDGQLVLTDDAGTEHAFDLPQA